MEIDKMEPGETIIIDKPASEIHAIAARKGINLKTQKVLVLSDINRKEPTVDKMTKVTRKVEQKKTENESD